MAADTDVESARSTQLVYADEVRPLNAPCS